MQSFVIHRLVYCSSQCGYLSFSSCWSDPLLPDLGKQDSHHFECHLVSRLPQVLLLHCVPLHPRWLHQCHPTCRQWHLPQTDLPPTQHHLQDWSGGCEGGRRSRRTEDKGHLYRQKCTVDNVCNGRLFSVIQPHLPIKHVYAMIDWRLVTLQYSLLYSSTELQHCLYLMNIHSTPGKVPSESQQNGHNQRLRVKEHGYHRPAISNSTYTATFSDAWNEAFRSTVCMHVWVIGHFTQTRGVTCCKNVGML